jgi:hypothetical protein
MMQTFFNTFFNQEHGPFKDLSKFLDTECLDKLRILSKDVKKITDNYIKNKIHTYFSTPLHLITKENFSEHWKQIKLVENGIVKECGHYEMVDNGICCMVCEEDLSKVCKSCIRDKCDGCGACYCTDCSVRNLQECPTCFDRLCYNNCFVKKNHNH